MINVLMVTQVELIKREVWSKQTSHKRLAVSCWLLAKEGITVAYAELPV
jgi:hypothetical protein